MFLLRRNKFILRNSLPNLKFPFLTYQNAYRFSQRPPEKPQEEVPQEDHIKEMLQKDEKMTQGFDADESSYTQQNSNVFVYAMGAFALLIGYVFMQLNVMSYDKKNANKKLNVTYSGKAQIGGPWRLITTDGKEMTEKDLKGSYYLIYFGFCNCPDICPASLYKISKAIQRIRTLPESRMFRLQTLFVSVDPDRDDNEKIKKWLSHFDSSIIGLTGRSNNDPELREAMRNFKIYASKISYEMDDQNETRPDIAPIQKKEKDVYTIDHTIITYLMDDNNNYVTFLGSNMSDSDISKTVVEKILDNERNKMKQYK